MGKGGNTIAYSTDASGVGASWAGQNVFTTGAGAGYGVAWNGRQLVAVGEGGNTTAYSTDGGITWVGNFNANFVSSYVGTTSPFTSTNYNICRSITWNNNMNQWVVINGDRPYAIGGSLHTKWSMATSPDGRIWTIQDKNVFTTACFGIKYNGSAMWVAVGEGGGNTIAYSTDGYSWTGLGATIFTTRGRAVDYDPSNNKWVAVGEGGNSIATSTNGMSWSNVVTPRLTVGYDVKYAYMTTANTHRWVAVGNAATVANTIVTSTDNGATWGAAGGLFTLGTGLTGGRSIAYTTAGGGGNGTWVAVGYASTVANTIVKSTNGTSWTGIGNTTVFGATTGLPGTAIAFKSSSSTEAMAFGAWLSCKCIYTMDITQATPTWTAKTSAFSTSGNKLYYYSPGNYWIGLGTTATANDYSNNTVRFSDTSGSTWLTTPAGKTFYRGSSFSTAAYAIAVDASNQIFIGGQDVNGLSIKYMYNDNFNYQYLIDTTLNSSQPNRISMACNTKRANQVTFKNNNTVDYSFNETFPVTMTSGEKYDVVSDAYNNLDFNNMTFSINQ